ncbi:MAG: hypothetical protein F3743_01120 [Nitrospinae bacterium]|nr:hypothetical protein [Nitrospinota bacterium]MZH13826.1 hypothetical protein [Nitrospinota bacterium]
MEEKELLFGEKIMNAKKKVLSFDELDADELKELIQSGSIKKPAKKTKKLPLKEEKPKSRRHWEIREAHL